MQLSLLIGAVFIATCAIQTQASDKKGGNPGIYGFKSGFLKPKPKEEKNNSSPETVPTNHTPKQKVESKSPRTLSK